MKTRFISAQSKHSQSGSAVMVIMVLLGIMMTLITANVVSVRTLNRELRLLDNRQKHHWESQEKK
jgi:hypothetical protein